MVEGRTTTYLKWEAKRVVGRFGAAVSGPVKVGRVLVGAACTELGQRDAEHKLVRDGHVALTRDNSVGGKRRDGGG